jgi:triacylglycerol lipase
MLLLAIALAVWLVESATAGPFWAGAISVGVFGIVSSLPFLLSIVLSQWISHKQVPGQRHAGFGTVLRSAPGEVLASMLAFYVLQPFDRLWMGPEAAPERGRGPLVVLVQGYLCNRGLWWWMRSRLRATGLRVATLNLEPPFGAIEGFAEQLHGTIEKLAEGGAADRVVLVAHSMGGLVSRAYLRRHGTAKVAKLVTIGSPHSGSKMTRFGYGQCAHDMMPEGAFLCDLPDAAALHVPAVTIWSYADELVVPVESARLEGAEDRIVPDIGHIAMVFSSTVLGLVLDEIAASVASPVPGTPCGAAHK